ncbi:MAG TPA: PKD domain-containing protein [Planctomycetota bacterium]|nr:PKD domain-containing protein [Planctomycetota bacterium]
MARIRCVVAASLFLSATAHAVDIHPGDDARAIVDAHPAGTTFIIRSGVHRHAAIRPKDDQVFIGEPGAILSGARRLTSFTREGALWFASNQTQQGQVHGDVEPGWRSQHAEDLFIDDQPLQHVASKAAVVPGTWFFDYDADRIWLGDDPAGRVVETSVTRCAFAPGASRVVIRALTVEKYAIPAQMGAIGDQYPTPGWTVADCTVRLNHGTGVNLGSGGRALRNRIVMNGQKGIGSNGDGVVVEGNEIAFNNWARFNAGWEAGGSKFALTDGLVVRDNWVHDNRGAGLWTDIDNIRTTYEYNTCARNRDAGIFHEISYAATIRHNSLIDNGTREWVYGAGIQISASRDVDVSGNLVSVRAGHGITLIAQNRGVGEFGPCLVRNVVVHGNEIVYHGADGLSGIGCDFPDPDAQGAAGGNRFDRNRYHAHDAGDEHWAWNDAARDWNGLRAQGQEPAGHADTQVVAMGEGVAWVELWHGIAGDAVADLTADARFPAAPDARRHLTRFEYAGVGDLYGARVRGVVHPPLTGDYVFVVAGDDRCQLWLGDDHRAATRRLIAHVPGWTAPREWTRFPAQRSAPVRLEAGRTYYIEALQKEGGGGDHLAVGWELPDGRAELPILGARLSPYAPPSGNAAPQSAFTAATAALTVDVDGAGASDADGAIVAWRWDFGDGALGHGIDAQHAYGTAGTYTVALTVLDDLGASATATRSVTVGAGDPAPPGTGTGAGSTAGGGGGGGSGGGCGAGAVGGLVIAAAALLLRRPR